MKITLEAAGIELTPALKTYVENKLGLLSKMVEKLEGKGETEIVVEVSRTTKHHHKGLVFRATGNLKFGKTLIRAATAHCGIWSVRRRKRSVETSNSRRNRGPVCRQNYSYQ